MTTALIEQTIESLQKNNYSVHRAATPEQAREIILNDILPQIGPGLVSFGDSLTLMETGILDDLRRKAGSDGWEFIDTFEKGVGRTEILERRRQALLSDIFFTGSNALTSEGQLVNLDMVGNRVAGIVWGPHHVVLTIGTNKIVDGIEQAIERIREIAAPLNAKRHGCKTPCAKTGRCMNCKSPDRICNVWTITEKSWPKGRITVMLIDGEHGL